MERANIYEITCRDPEVRDKYVGITKNIRRRRCNHKSHCHNQNSKAYNTHVYQFIRANGGWSNWRLDTVFDVEYPRGRNDMKAALEARYIRELSATLNKIMPGRTREQYRQDHKQEAKQYYQDHKVERKAQMKQYNQDHKAKINAKQKQYRLDHKDEINARDKQYRQDNRVKIEAKQKAKHDCQCGGRYTHQNSARHFKTKRHTGYIEYRYYMEIYGTI